MQFLAALPDQPPAFRPIPPMLEFEQTPNPLRDELAREPIVQRRGVVAVPDGPGLGIEVDREVLDRFKVAERDAVALTDPIEPVGRGDPARRRARDSRLPPGGGAGGAARTLRRERTR